VGEIIALNYLLYFDAWCGLFAWCSFVQNRINWFCCCQVIIYLY